MRLLQAVVMGEAGSGLASALGRAGQAGAGRMKGRSDDETCAELSESVSRHGKSLLPWLGEGTTEDCCASYRNMQLRVSHCDSKSNASLGYTRSSRT